MRNPDASAIADTSRLLPGILAAGVRSGSAFALSGTSVATPHVVRWIAGEIAKPANRSGFDTASFIRDLATQNEHTLAASEFAGLASRALRRRPRTGPSRPCLERNPGKLKPEPGRAKPAGPHQDPDAQNQCAACSSISLDIC
jgi:hypothetical protein